MKFVMDEKTKRLEEQRAAEPVREEIAGYLLVGTAAVLGAYAVYLFDTRLSEDLAKAVIGAFS